MTLSLSESSGKAASPLVCTPEHPLWVSGRGWVEAGSLSVGDRVLARDGQALSVTAIKWQRAKDGQAFTVYNLTVQGDHSYFAGKDHGGVWAHNCPGGTAGPRLHRDAQGKHIVGHKNYEPGRSILTEDPDAMMSKLGTGDPVTGIPGQSGYKERIDFGKVIGQYVDQQTGIATPTTKAIVTYSKHGVHFIPARP